MGKTEKVTALKLLSCLSEETKILIYRELTRSPEGCFTGRLGWGKVYPEEDTEKLTVLMAIEKETEEETKLRQKEVEKEEAQESRMLD